MYRFDHEIYYTFTSDKVLWTIAAVVTDQTIPENERSFSARINKMHIVIVVVVVNVQTKVNNIQWILYRFQISARYILIN